MRRAELLAGRLCTARSRSREAGASPTAVRQVSSRLASKRIDHAALFRTFQTRDFYVGRFPGNAILTQLQIPVTADFSFVHKPVPRKVVEVSCLAGEKEACR